MELSWDEGETERGLLQSWGKGHDAKDGRKPISDADLEAFLGSDSDDSDGGSGGSSDGSDDGSSDEEGRRSRMPFCSPAPGPTPRRMSTRRLAATPHTPLSLASLAASLGFPRPHTT